MRCSLVLLTAALCAGAELQVPSDVVVERGIDYNSIPHGKLAMDVVRPKSPGKYPGIVLIHEKVSGAGGHDRLDGASGKALICPNPQSRQNRPIPSDSS